MSRPESFRELMLVEDPGFADVMRCVFGIREHETEAYLTLLDAPDSTAKELADELDRDRSNVSRSLSTLREKGLVERRRKLLDGGGHVYCYAAEPLPAVRERLHEELDAWTEFVHGRIDDFGGPE
ncbi:helix-turn-helix domain-containing protein [Halorussus sp. AFM4]|uniref:helix-turn-helix domain-containing protein n=1 Tax=Halorussus sp. AFM4 TaxID=3421651 RepID=UPI003EBD24A0